MQIKKIAKYGIKHKILEKFKYGMLLHFFLTNIKKIGIYINLFYLYDIKLSDYPMHRFLDHSYKLKLLKKKDLGDILHMSGYGKPKTDLLNRFNKGEMCYSIKHERDLVALYWIIFGPIKKNINNFELKINKNQVYLYDLFVPREYRGNNLATYLESSVQKKLHKKGIKHSIFYVDFFNRPAVRVRKKQNIKPGWLLFNIQLFRKYTPNLIIDLSRWRLLK